jgi:VIT1/CCC1 family predicted Fe2+/Mn2+ transporter
VQTAVDPEQAKRVIAQALPPPVALVLGSTELDRICQLLRRLPAPPTRPRLNLSDWRGAVGVFLLVVLSTLPVVMPFMFLQNVMTAQRLSNAIALCLLFFTGHAFGRCTGYHPTLTGLSMVGVGVVLVAITIALGG